MDNVITLYEITAQEEIFCQFYLQTVSAGRSAFYAGFLNNIKENVDSYDDLKLRQQKDLSTMGNKTLKKPAVKRRISELAEEKTKEYKCAELDELLLYLTTVIRKSKENFQNVTMINSALRAIELMLKRYPEFQKGVNNEAEKYNFSRFSKEGT
ncbi:MAG: hypothetical protein EHM20_00100 [Alphaproteobacteria bacterium]|nr:MAG: hypothetical protein EHM20_00100 [Alphaproteobacteria bacterium]